MTRLPLALCVFLLLVRGAFAGPRVDVVVGPGAPPLERFAADELSALLKQLFDADVRVSDKAPADVANLILLGRPETNPALKAAAGDRWPKLSDQGHTLRSVTHDGRPALLVGGGSPLATLWAAYELGHHFGARYLLYGDVLPVTRPALRLDGIDAVLEPTVARRGWLAAADSALGPETWPAGEQKRFLGQLVKLKFNNVVLSVSPKRDVPFAGRRFAVDGDTAGRDAFRGAAVFENPHFAGATTAADRARAMTALSGGLRAAARERGLVEALDPNAPAPPAQSLLPRMRVEGFHAFVGQARRKANAGVTVYFGVAGDHDLAAYYLARAGFDAAVTPKSACDDLITPICGAGVSERVAKGFAMVEGATNLIAANDPAFAAPAPDVVMKHYADQEVPAWWKKAGTLYAGALDEMLRGNTRARDGARPFTVYQAKHLEFAFHYMSAVEALRLAGRAKAKKNAEEQAAKLERAVEAMHNALSAYGEVARDASDRAVIAMLNEFGYRPLRTQLEAAEKAARKR